MDDKFTRPYNPADTESRIYAQWEESGYFNPDNLPGERTKPFTIVMPPPNANGNLHAGHALFITLEDLFIRFRRMQGYKALWIPGADHAGFETQVVYEKQLEKEGRSRFQMDPKDLYEEILAFTLANKKNMEKQVRELGASCDWSREKFTLDPDVVSEVQKTFVKMFADGLIYRGKRTINWCYKHQTSLSDVETESVEEKAPFYYFKYGPFEIGTVRPETKFGDKYVVMHPEDERYAQYAHGQKLTVEWIQGPIEATIIKDAAVDREFGTGVMTITPWHSQVDFEIAKRHGLDMEQIIDWRGKLLPIAGEFAGMNIKDARPKIVEKLAAKGLVTRVDEDYQHVVKRCYKCNTMIEPQIRDQWFVKMAPLAQMALESVNHGDIRFIPDNQEKIFRYWMENTLDWNISRQIVWGIPIPAWFRHAGTPEEEIVASTERPEGEGWEADTDTFDTWFSSGQWPLITTGYPDGKDYQTYYPTDVMESGHDLIFKWIPRMIIFGLYLGKKAPFHTVYLHGLVNDANGRKMSKSKGNVINPLDLTSKYGDRCPAHEPGRRQYPRHGPGAARGQGEGLQALRQQALEHRPLRAGRLRRERAGARGRERIRAAGRGGGRLARLLRHGRRRDPRPRGIPHLSGGGEGISLRMAHLCRRGAREMQSGAQERGRGGPYARRAQPLRHSVRLPQAAPSLHALHH